MNATHNYFFDKVSTAVKNEMIALRKNDSSQEAMQEVKRCEAVTKEKQQTARDNNCPEVIIEAAYFNGLMLAKRQYPTVAIG